MTTMSTSAASNSCSSTELSDHDPSENLEGILNSKELKDELIKKVEEEKKAAAARGEPSYNEDSGPNIEDDGRMLSDRIVCYERILRVHKVMKTPGMKKMSKHSQKPKRKVVIRQDHFRRGHPRQNNLNSNQSERRVFWCQRRLYVQIERTSPLPY